MQHPEQWQMWLFHSSCPGNQRRYLKSSQSLWISRAGCGRLAWSKEYMGQRVHGPCAGCSPKAVMLALVANLCFCAMGSLSLPWGLIFPSTWMLHVPVGYIPAPGQKIMCKVTHAACFQRAGVQHASRLWEELLQQRVMDGGNLGCHCAYLI